MVGKKLLLHFELSCLVSDILVETMSIESYEKTNNRAKALIYIFYKII